MLISPNILIKVNIASYHRTALPKTLKLSTCTGTGRNYVNNLKKVFCVTGQKCCPKFWVRVLSIEVKKCEHTHSGHN